MTALFFIAFMILSVLDFDMTGDIFIILFAATVCFLYDNLLLGSLSHIRSAIEMVARKIDDA